MSDNWLSWARRIQSIAQAGLAYSKDPFDRQRFEQLLALAAEIVARSAGMDADEVLATLSAERGYPTPKVDVRAVVFRERDLLFVREVQDGRWSLPGGWADVGDSPGRVAAKEALEESGFTVRPVKLLAVYGTPTPQPGGRPSLWHSYKLFVRCTLVGGSARPSIETDAVAFFSEAALPELSELRVTRAQVARMFEHLRAPDLPTDFD